MINTESNGNGGVINGTCSPAQDKQPPGVIKKTALRDVQNEKLLSNSMQKPQKIGEAVKVSGTKRLTPEQPLSSKFLPSLAQSGANENVMNARRRFDLEFGRGGLQNKIEGFSVSSHLEKISQQRQETPKMAIQARDRNVGQTPVATPKNMTPIMAFSSSTPSFPSSFGRKNVSSEATKVPVKSNIDQLRAEQQRAEQQRAEQQRAEQQRAEKHARLQRFLKECDESNQKDILEMLFRLSPAELSERAWELENRAITLAIEEGEEEERRKSLNILVKHSPSNNLLQSSKS